MKTEKKTTLEEVKEYFKNAAEIKGLYSNDNIKIDTEKFGVIIDCDYFRQGKDDDDNEVMLYDPHKGYAKITKFKKTTNQQNPAGETLTKGKLKAKLIWNNIHHTETINFDTLELIPQKFINLYNEEEELVSRINTDLVTVIITH